MSERFNVTLAKAFGCGMLDAQNIVKMITKENAHRFVELPTNVPLVDDVKSAMDAYRLGYWTETRDAAKRFLTVG